MGRQRKPTTQDLLRFDGIAKHLNVKSRFGDASFTEDVVAACVARVAPTVKKLLPCSGEELVIGLGQNLGVKFEDVHGPHDIDRLHDHYVKGKKEIGFAQIRTELGNPEVDALLFQRMHAKAEDPDRWVAVLNLQEGESKAHWNKSHELAHRIAEPPQGILPFHRHRFDAGNPLEALIDAVASELAFYGPVFRPLVVQYAKTHRLSFAAIEAIRNAYAPSASLLSTMNAVVRYWPRPAAALTAEFRGRSGNPHKDQALRVSPQSYNDLATVAGLAFFKNMRVPENSPIHSTFKRGSDHYGDEHLGDWVTSDGKQLTPIPVFTAARLVKRRIYAVMSA